MKISDENKFDVLLAQLQERYEALHKMRDRSMQFVLWVLGLGLGLAWLSINEVVFTLSQKLTITALFVAIGVVALIFICAIERGFNANRETAIRIENALCLYKRDFYGVEEPILPGRFANRQTGWTGHFKMLYTLIIVFFLLLVLLTWTNPCRSVPNDHRTQSDRNQIQNTGYLIEV